MTVKLNQEDATLKENYEPIKNMKDVPEQLRKLRREFIRNRAEELVLSELVYN